MAGKGMAPEKGRNLSKYRDGWDYYQSHKKPLERSMAGGFAFLGSPVHLPSPKQGDTPSLGSDTPQPLFTPKDNEDC